MTNTFPAISVQGQRVEAKQHVEPGTNPTVYFAFIFATLASLVGVILSYGVLLVVAIFYPMFSWHVNRKAKALIHGSGVKIGSGQFPEIYKCLSEFKERLGLAKDVDAYIVEANVINAAAVRYGKTNVILLTDDLIHGCLASGKPQALAFVIAHELAHIALNHTGLIRSWLAQHMKKLGRKDEYSADAVAMALVGDKMIAYDGLLLLTVGHAMMPFVNIDDLKKQMNDVAANKYSKKAEHSLTHPLLFHRLGRVFQSKN